MFNEWQKESERALAKSRSYEGVRERNMQVIKIAYFATNEKMIVAAAK